ncbi:DUF302 domain-containing protein [Pseudaestuariivita sp.]|uniref:DUF302 domain-containing protein n=1 Tax=Pseudaestuariivita sp. TaxID=2211669 RepID=UPI0040582DAB
MKLAALLTTSLFLCGTAVAEPIKVATDKTVDAAADALEAAIDGAGAKVFARVDHGEGAESVGADIGESQLIIFGNPKVGTPAMEAARTAGLALPLKVLVYEDQDGAVWLAYEDPAKRIADAGGTDMASKVTDPMQTALENLTQAAAN